jgi:hypothetical protein
LCDERIACWRRSDLGAGIGVWIASAFGIADLAPDRAQQRCRAAPGGR